KSPNRQVGDLSRWPTRAGLGPRSRQIPQPAGWGSFTLAYKSRARTSLQTNPPTGRLGIFHAGLQEQGADLAPDKSPNRQVGDLSRWPTRAGRGPRSRQI